MSARNWLFRIKDITLCAIFFLVPRQSLGARKMPESRAGESNLSFRQGLPESRAKEGKPAHNRLKAELQTGIPRQGGQVRPQSRPCDWVPAIPAGTTAVRTEKKIAHRDLIEAVTIDHSAVMVVW